MLKVRTLTAAASASARAASGASVAVAAAGSSGSSSSSSRCHPASSAAAVSLSHAHAHAGPSSASVRAFSSSTAAGARAKSSKTTSPRQQAMQANKLKRTQVAVAKSLAPVDKIVSRSLSSLSQVPQTMPAVTEILSAVQKRALIHDPNALKLEPTRKERRAVIKAQRKDAKARRKQMSVAARLGISTKESTPFVRKDRQFKTFKPITTSLRWVRIPLNEHLHKGKPEAGLTVAKRSTGGRNHHGHVTVRGRGGGHKRRLRLVDFYRWEAGEQDVLRIEYDPGRSAHIALLQHCETGAKSYILAPEGLRAGDKVQSYRSDHTIGQGGKLPAPRTPSSSNASTSPESPQTVNPPELEEEEDDSAFEDAEQAPRQQSALDLGIFRTRAIRPGNVLPLSLIPIGTTIHAISLHPGGPAKLCRSAGTSGQLIAFTARKQAATGTEAGGAAAGGESSGFGTDKSHAQVKLQSGEVRLVPVRCVAAVGRVSNPDHEHRRLGKAGRSRWLGRRPKVRGVAMNAVDHPHGGGRGKSKSNMHPRSKWGLLKFARTRKPGSRRGNKMVVRPRPRANGKRQGKA